MSDSEKIMLKALQKIASLDSFRDHPIGINARTAIKEATGVEYKNGDELKEINYNFANYSIIKLPVCDRCESLDRADLGCVCIDGSYTTVELEFRECRFCGSVDPRPIYEE